MQCPHCSKEIPDADLARHLAAKGGSSTSDAKQKASRENGKKGGRKPMAVKKYLESQRC